ncbi:MAG: hypothetical protein R3E63_08130 [Pseudomonadales bacterium]
MMIFDHRHAASVIAKTSVGDSYAAVEDFSRLVWSTGARLRDEFMEAKEEGGNTALLCFTTQTRGQPVMRCFVQSLIELLCSGDWRHAFNFCVLCSVSPYADGASF